MNCGITVFLNFVKICYGLNVLFVLRHIVLSPLTCNVNLHQCIACRLSIIRQNVPAIEFPILFGKEYPVDC